ncbi:MAG: cation diffusion facilitator family transporter, partial [Acidiferrobacterales bacterium]|nr:cation diffusion facilitator family transporter [Acidiferrobacterales bacterium]
MVSDARGQGLSRLPPTSPERADRVRDIYRVTLVGSAVDLALGVVKVAFGITAHSQALIADGVHSLSDLATDVLVLYAAKHGSREADEEHPYGHGRIETLATVGLGVALIATAVGISFDAARRLFRPELLLAPGAWALVIAALSIVLKEAIYHYTMRAARRYRSSMLRANAWHSRTDAFSSVIVVVGVAGTMAGLTYLDSIAAVGVALMIAKIGWDLGWQGARELVDTGLDPHRVETIRRTITSVHGVQALHMLRSRRMGGDALVDVHIQVDPTLSVSEGHQISETVRARLINEIEEVSDVMVHIDPEDDEAAVSTASLPLRDAVRRRLDERFADIEAAKRIDRLTLHYYGGKLRVELLLPLDVLGNGATADALSRRFNDAVQNDPQIAGVEL